MSFDAPAQDARPAIVLAVPKEASLGGDDSRQANGSSIPRKVTPAGADARPTIYDSLAPSPPTSGGNQLAGRQDTTDTQVHRAASDQPADRSFALDAQGPHAVGSSAAQGPAANVGPKTTVASLLDPALAFAADVLDDIERVRIANENRLRQLTRSVKDSDGELRGFGLDESHPDVARLAAIVSTLKQVEDDATKHLTKVMQRHPLHAWAKSMKGVGDKQIARLLAVIGDPYWRPEIVSDADTMIPAGPRTVSALWAYCGLHTTPVDSQYAHDAHRLAVDGEQPPVSRPSASETQTVAAADGVKLPMGQGADNDHQGGAAHGDQHAGRHLDQSWRDDHVRLVWVAARRQRGQKANWNTNAKTRANLIAESCGKQLVKPCIAGEHVEDCRCSPYRLLYERRKAATEGRVHAVACARCGPSGKPAQPGTLWSDGHRHADALRIVAKEILKDLWREAKRVHETTPLGQQSVDAQPVPAGRGSSNQTTPPDQMRGDTQRHVVGRSNSQPERSR